MTAAVEVDEPERQRSTLHLVLLFDGELPGSQLHTLCVSLFFTTQFILFPPVPIEVYDI